MGEIWANQLLPKALKTCPKSNKSPNMVTLILSLKSLIIESSLMCNMFFRGKKSPDLIEEIFAVIIPTMRQQ